MQLEGMKNYNMSIFKKVAITKMGNHIMMIIYGILDRMKD